ncbi:MAG TPA: hypothetical protein VE957_18805 [Terriglobales bacterium]|nr:hypothetical protein [Terriglobales bacterium]
MSEKSVGNAHDDVSEIRTSQDCSASRPRMGIWDGKTSPEQYNSGESELKKEIPDEGYARVEASFRAAGIGDGVSATKPNDNWPKNSGLDPQLLLTYSWTKNAGAKQSVEFLAKAPEGPAEDSSSHTSRDEPAGK